MESGIEVMEEEGRVRVLMPVSPRELRAKPGRGMGVVGSWGFAFIAGAVGVGVIVGLGAEAARHWPFQGWADWALAAVTALQGFMIGGMCFASVAICLFRNRSWRREVVIDRRGVCESGFGPMDLWRVRLKEIRAVVVRRPRGKMAEGLAAGEVWARVAIVSRAGGRSVSGVYPYGVAMEAAHAIAGNVSRVRAAAFGGTEGEVQVRDDIEGTSVDGVRNGVLEVYGASFERHEGGIRVELGRLLRASNPQPGEAFLVMADQKVWVFAALMGLMMVGVGVGQLGAIGDIAGKILAGMALWGWMVWVFGVRVTYEVGHAGVERRIGLFAWERRRHWKREEIGSVSLRMRGIGRGRVWEVGLSPMNGRRVGIAMGPRGTAEAFAEVLERELGMGEAVDVGNVGGRLG